MTTITYTLPGFPQVNQLVEGTADGAANENARMNCVVDALRAGLAYLTGRDILGDAIKDAVYGQGYQGAMAADHFVAYCAALGVRLAPFSSADGAALVAHLHQLIEDRASPALVTMPSQWAYAPSDPLHPAGWTHVGVACGSGPGCLRVMNPWGGFWQDMDDDWWAPRLCFGAVWDLTRITTQEAIVVNVGGLEPGLAALAQQEGSDAASPETPLTAQGDTYARLANGGVIWWDAANKVGHTDQPAHVVAALEATIADLKRQLAAAKAAQAPAPTTSVPGVADLAQTVADAQSYRAVKAALALLLK